MMRTVVKIDGCLPIDLATWSNLSKTAIAQGLTADKLIELIKKEQHYNSATTN